MVVAITQRQWRSVVKATGLLAEFSDIESATGFDLNEEGDRFRAREAISKVLTPWIAARSLDELRAIFDQHRVLWGPYQSIRQLMHEDPSCSPKNSLFQRVEQPGVGPHLMTGSPLSFGATPRPDVRPAPQLGQHTDELLREFIGCSETEIRKLRSAAIVA
jgi:2-methylfumaryl-CoA isomerase